MTLVNGIAFNVSKLSLSPKVTALESSLQQSLTCCRDLLSDADNLCLAMESCRRELLKQREKCESKCCNSSEALKKDIESKDNLIQRVASAVTKLSETKDFTIVSDIFRALCGETTVMTPPKDSQERLGEEKMDTGNNTPILTDVKKKLLSCNEQVQRKDEIDLVNRISVVSPDVNSKLISNNLMKCEGDLVSENAAGLACIQKTKNSPEKELCSSLDDVSFNDESVTEIEGTPGRTSPILPIRKPRSFRSDSPDTRDKKKCPGNWRTPEAKLPKLRNNARKNPGNGRYRQQRLPFVNVQPTSVVDLTSSPELSGGSRNAHSGSMCDIQRLIKKESSENDDTILPSPTSGPAKFLLPRPTKENQNKFKSLSLKVKTENMSACNALNDENKPERDDTDVTAMEESINILQPRRFPISPNKKTPPKVEPHEDDVTHCDITMLHTASSVSLLHQVAKLKPNDQQTDNIHRQHNSCTKLPLAENMNVTNVPAACDKDSSVSLLNAPVNTNKVTPAIEEKAKRRTPEKVEQIYQEPTVRRKAEKRALPAWCCDECRHFYGELYKDEPDKIAEVIANCGKHRGRHNPARPKTPPGFWYPRWDVPEDTEQFNRRNNVD